MNKQIGKQDRNRAGVSGCHYRVLVQDFYDSFPRRNSLDHSLENSLEKKELALFYVILFTLSCSVGPQ